MAETTSYRRSLGLLELVSLGVGGTIGSGIFVVPGIAARLTGVWSLFAWLIVAVSASCVLFSLASVSARFTDSGGFYSLFESVFGRRAAAPLIVIYLVSSIFGISTIAAGIGQYIGYFGLAQVLVIEIGIIAGFCCINIIGISLAGKTETLLTLIKIVPLILIAFLLLPFVRLENLAPAAPLTTAGLLATVIIVYWPFTGFEISAIPVEETTDPRLIKKSLICVMAIVVSVYLLLNIALIGSVGVAVLAASPAPVATAAALVIADAGPVVVCIGIVAMLSAINAYIIGTSRILQNLSARFGIPRLRKLGARGTPVYALVAGCGIAASLLLISNHFDQLASISVITTLIPYLFFCIASWILVEKTRTRVVSAAGALSTFAILILYFFL
ncbi:MAG: APC family permease [Methanoregula sp.]|jgi:amino acid transporter|uniref:APC family permease n=1 Tax=Methanoregula sp. TaxID=2052170 RepID=UPI003C1D36EA